MAAASARPGSDKSNGKTGALEVPLGGSAALPGSALTVARGRLPSGLHDVADGHHVPGRRAAEPGGAHRGLREGGKEIFAGWIFTRFPDVHPFTHPRFQLRLDGGVPKTEAVDGRGEAPSASSSRAAPTSASRRSSTGSCGGGGRSFTTFRA